MHFRSPTEEDLLPADDDEGLNPAECPPDEDDGADDEEEEPHTAGPQPARIKINADGITVSELRNLCSDVETPKDTRLGLMLIYMWLVTQTEQLDTARRKAATLSVQVRDGKTFFGWVAWFLFPDATTGIPEKKAGAMIIILGASLVPVVKDLAFCHVSSKCPLTEEHTRAARTYAVRLARQKPNLTAFTRVDKDDPEKWWPEFPEDVAAEVPKHA